MKKVYVVDFTEIFSYADTNFGISWNKANDLFFKSETLRYLGYNDIWAEELDKEELVDKILLSFMEKNNLEHMLVLNG